MLRVLSPAKINLHLSVGPLRPDGYHELTSVFHALELTDELTVQDSHALSLSCDVELGVGPQENLAYQAAQAMGDRFDRDPAVRIEIAKRIPHGAGLGGGSSNAAAVIAALAVMWGIDPRCGECHEVARALGADVPFFLVPSGAALMTGRGDETRREVPAFEGVDVVLVRPLEPVSTAQAYAAFDRQPVVTASADSAIRALELRDAPALGAATFNNLAAASISVLPVVGEVLGWVRFQAGVLGAQVSGSGSAVFALCESAAHVESIVEAATERGWWAMATRLGSHGVTVCEEG